MKNSIRKKLLASGIVVLVFVLLIMAASQVSVGLFRTTSEKLVIEYHELDAIQEFKLSLGRLMVSISNYAVYNNDQESTPFNDLIFDSKEKLEVCRIVVTESHEKELLDQFESGILSVDSLANRMFELKNSNNKDEIRLLYNALSEIINSNIKGVDNLLNETKLEIDEYEEINNTVIKHSTITFLTLGFIIILIFTIVGLLFIRNLTRPIKELVTTTNRISEGDRSAKVKIESNDEFQTLALSFNRMVDTLEKTTVSKDFLNNILENMFDALIVTDLNLKIRSVNQASISLLEYSETELLNLNILHLFNVDVIADLSEDVDLEMLKQYRDGINKSKYLISKSTKKIPVLLSCTLLRLINKEVDGLIVVAYDLTEKKIIEDKLENSRKEKLIAINEAQEKERVRIAKDLHDGLGQMLTGISYSVQNLINHGELEKVKLENAVHNIQERIDSTIQETRNLAHSLIPIILQDFGLIAAVKNLVSKANDDYEIKFVFNAFDFKERVEPRLEKALYRICQESINNIVKHSKANHVNIQIFRAEDMIVLVIDDDGIGFDITAYNVLEDHDGIGLASIHERVIAFNGILTIDSGQGNGTELIIEIPCKIK